jgi:hypothetical protein
MFGARRHLDLWIFRCLDLPDYTLPLGTLAILVQPELCCYSRAHLLWFIRYSLQDAFRGGTLALL